MKPYRRKTSTYGFKPATGLLQTRIKKASETRGFAETRLLTHWAEIVGEAIAGVAHPVDVSYGRGGMGATLSVLCTGAQAPMIEMQKDQIRDKVNACYGYRAISRVRITQTAPSGFVNGQIAFGGGNPVPKAPEKDPETLQAADDVARDVENDDLRQAIAALAANVLAKRDA